MNYELAKELKDAGFPQPDDPVCSPGGSYTNGKETAYGPTLEELIEAVNKDQKRGMFLLAFEKNTWSAQYSDYDRVFVEDCATPTEAVARLYIALNKKV